VFDLVLELKQAREQSHSQLLKHQIIRVLKRMTCMESEQVGDFIIQNLCDEINECEFITKQIGDQVR
jgi:hypothetical protein